MTTTISSANTAPVTTQGIGSGLDIASIVDKLVTVASAPLTRIADEGDRVPDQAFRVRAGQAARFPPSRARSHTLTTSAAFAELRGVVRADSTIASVSIDSTNAKALSVGFAHAHRLASSRTRSARHPAAFTRHDVTAVGTGTHHDRRRHLGQRLFDVHAERRTSGSKTITIDSSNNSLSGIRDAINSAKRRRDRVDRQRRKRQPAGRSPAARPAPRTAFASARTTATATNLDASGLSQRRVRSFGRRRHNADPASESTRYERELRHRRPRDLEAGQYRDRRHRRPVDRLEQGRHHRHQRSPFLARHEQPPSSAIGRASSAPTTRS